MIQKEQDPLRDYIREHRSSFDTQKAPAGMWDVIEAQLPETKGQTNYWKWLGIFSMVMILGLSLAFLWLKRDTAAHLEGSPMVEDTEVLEFAHMPDFNETQQYYTTQVNETWAELKKIHYDATLEKDLSLLDEHDRELRDELKDAEGIYKEHVLQALIQNQQIKLNLLMDVLGEIKNSEAQKKNNYETI